MALTYKGPSSLGIQGDYTKPLRDLGAQGPSQFATKTGALEPTTTAALIGAGASILSTILGYALAPDPYVPEEKEERPKLTYQGKEPVNFVSQLSDPGSAMTAMNTSTNVGMGGAPRATALQRIRKNYQLPAMT